MALIAGALVAPLVSVTAHASVRWRPCERLPLECTTVSAKPSGRKIDIAVSRKKATKAKRGVLLLNPGGPGDAGLEEPTYLRALRVLRNGQTAGK